MTKIPFHQTKGIRSFTVLALAAVAVLFFSCSAQEEESLQTAAGDGPAKVEPLYFSVSCEGSSETRGTPQEEDLNGEFIVLGSTYTGDWDGTQTMNFIYNGTVVDNGSYWRTVMGFAVPNAGTNMRFFAYFPDFDEDEGNGASPITLSSQVNPGMPYFSYVVPDSAQQQKDLMVALTDQVTSTGSLKNNPVDLTFKHLLTAVRFKVDNSCPKGFITKIVIKDVKYMGDYTFGNASWTAIGTSVKTVTMKTRLVTGMGMDDQVSDAFMLMPQTLGSTAKIQITFNNGRDYTLETAIDGKEWAQGKLTTYTIKMSSLKQMALTAEVQNWGRGKNLSYDTTY